MIDVRSGPLSGNSSIDSGSGIGLGHAALVAFHLIPVIMLLLLVVYFIERRYRRRRSTRIPDGDLLHRLRTWEIDAPDLEPTAPDSEPTAPDSEPTAPDSEPTARDLEQTAPDLVTDSSDKPQKENL